MYGMIDKDDTTMTEQEAAVSISKEPAMEAQPNLFMTDQGMDLFSAYVIDYLSIQDVLACAKTGKLWHRRCRTFTLHELLQHTPNNSEEDNFNTTKKQEHNLRQRAFKTLRRYCCSDHRRPTRLVIVNPFHWFFDKLYHPAEVATLLNMIKQLHLQKVDISSSRHSCKALSGRTRRTEGTIREKKDLKQGETLGADQRRGPILLKALFGFENSTIDVTGQVERLIIQDHGQLILTPPVVLASQQKGTNLKCPSTIQWWYTRLFGDPCPGVEKELVLLVSHPNESASRTATIRLPENRTISMRLMCRRRSSTESVHGSNE